MSSICRADAPRIGLGVVGLGAAVAVRVAIAGAGGARSVTAGIVFAALALVIAAALGRLDLELGWRDFGYGVAGAALLCTPPLARHLASGSLVGTTKGYAAWAPAVVFVALSEEALLRGSLFAALESWRGTSVAIIVTAVLFGFMHAPLYGLHVVPLDIAVGVWLGALRAATGAFTAPAIAHSIADLAGWWLR